MQVAVSDLKTGLLRLSAEGRLAWSGGKPVLVPPLPLVAGGKPLSTLVREDRG
jgi:hypothetical protein